MDFSEAIQILNSALEKEQPIIFGSSWIYHHTPQVWRFIWKNVKTELGDIDWDQVVCKLNKPLQERWVQRRPKKIKPYRNIKEVKVALKKFEPKLYVFIAPADKDDRLLRDAISIVLVRVAQKGNIRAQQKLLELLRYMVDQWIEVSWKLKRWKGYNDDLEDTLKACIRRYRFTGTFIGYLFRTLEYAGRGLHSLQMYSLDEPVRFDSEKRKIDSVIQDPETNEILMYSK